MPKILMSQHDSIRAVEWKDNHLVLLDQRKLPHNEQYVQLYSAEETADAIRNMVVRGAPAIGIAAAYGVVMAARKSYKQYPQDWRNRLEAEKDVLMNARPTAVNLMWALRRMCAALEGIQGDPEPVLLELAQRIHQDDIDDNYRMGELGSALIQPSHGVLTHCNTGSLATGGYGTALGVIRSAYSNGKIEHVYADETRPWWQGSRLTAWELVKDKIPAHLLCEGAAASLMRQGKVSWVIVGSDRIAANGDVANKIGTYSLAVNARYHGVRFMVVAPTSTIDMNTLTGNDIPIEERSQDEVLNVGNQRIAAMQAQAWNPAFDVTPAALVDALVTEKGVIERPNAAKMAALMAS
ncbi:S-methyl-5-thioribose-1-phosphate isomerase [Candidatus Thiothrix anitrata]|jgi:methylthioribose-1-phosphate isomerase|uniref:Methylthioribose-1-phosphate isomerase n=3 Tax=Thiotrichaceae TaxID=135617 RepID=A0A975FCH4_9GAMM|nr:S-methyl-5-thioribose-1-phosphate isomerase [Candidatus Thiothrix anitrata]QTR55096.1 S-methyl-5-thioribose-1-phosphate isomerase [Thiothrix unzii]